MTPVTCDVDHTGIVWDRVRVRYTERMTHPKRSLLALIALPLALVPIACTSSSPVSKPCQIIVTSDHFQEDDFTMPAGCDFVRAH